MWKTFEIPSTVKMELTDWIEQYMKEAVELYAKDLIEQQVDKFRIELQSKQYNLVRDVMVRLKQGWYFEIWKSITISIPIEAADKLKDNY